jgi:hypothetical protein
MMLVRCLDAVILVTLPCNVMPEFDTSEDGMM